MRKKISICLLAMAITLGTYYIAYGVSSFKTQFNTRYGTTGTAIDQCILCHATNNGPNIPSTETPPNPYGVALENNGLNFAAVESLDSDGDGFNNITEINARTFPGNSASRPAAGDTTAPTVTAFSIPATSSSLSVPITAFAATDNIGVTGYMVNESSTKPLATAAGWTASAPASYTASAAGARTLYAWAKDAAGNVSNSRSASVTITLTTTDTTAPTVTAFTIPATSTSLTVSITSFTATDNVAVTGYMVNESSTKPLATAAGWTTTRPASYTFATAGAKTLYAWAKDAAGNVSNSRSASVTITLTTTDTTAPTVTAFSIPATSSSLSVPITAFAATDNIGVTGYMVNESSTKPLATAAGWTASAPASYTASAAGARTLYAWAKDAAGNVSNSRSASTTITLSQPTQGPTFSNPTAITNRYLPLANLNQDILEGTMGGQVLHVERTLMGNTKNFKVGNQTVATLIVEERSFVDNVLQEVSLGYFAQADDGTVYSFGEKVNVYDSSGQVVGHQGSWQYGVDTNQLGITMPAYSQSRSRIRFRPQDNVPAVTIPNATVARVWRMTVPAGRFRRCLRITETLSDGTVEHRYYAPNVGLIKEVFPGGELSLISHNQPAENNIENDIENNLENNIENDAQK